MQGVVRGGLLLVVVLLAAVLLAAGVVLHAGLSKILQTQAQVREARGARTAVMELQLDEETGVRGYGATGDTSFLQPYHVATMRWAPAIAALARDVGDVAPRAVPFVVSESLIHEQWHRDFVTPVLIHQPLGQSAAVELRGRDDMDMFRADDRSLEDALAGAAARNDRAASSFADEVTFWSAVVAIAVAGVVLAIVIVLLGSLEKLSAQRREIDAKDRLAEMLQEAFVLQSLPKPKGLRFSGIYVPAETAAAVGGDWYDAYELPGGRVIFSIGDVCGHGVEAAVLMTRVRQALIAIGMTEADPARVLELTNRVLNVQEGPMVTCVFATVDPGAGLVSYATAGHPPPILVSPGGKARQLQSAGMPLGVVAQPGYVSQQTPVEKGEMFLLYTDGLVERDRDLLRGEKRLLAVARRALRFADPAAYIYEQIFRRAAPLDDVAILGVRFAGVASKGVVEEYRTRDSARVS